MSKMWILRRKGGITAKALAQACQCKASKTFIPRRKHFIINYGGNYEFADLNKNVIFNKLTVYEKLKEAGISQPRMFKKGENIPDEAFPLLARKKYHSQGRDITYVANREQLERLEDWKYDFLTEYIDKKSEYRVHILGDNASVSVKFNNDGRGDSIVRSHSNGWKQIAYNGEWHEELIMLATKAIDALEYNFGAVDIIRKKNKLYLLEVNSAPGLEPRKLELYKNYFIEEERKWREENE